MALNINTSNYINNQNMGSGNSAGVSGQINMSGDGAVVSVKGLDLTPGQTLSGQVIEIDGRDIKLLLGNNQTINAKLEGNINALLGQTLSFEVKNTDNGQTALRPLYTNLNNSPQVANALTSAGLPHTENYAKMVSSMMDEGMPINKNALYQMAKNVNSFPTANPETVVRLNKLGLQINELTINQYENYKGLERQITGDVDKLTSGLTDLVKETASEYLKELGIDNISNTNTAGQTARNLLSAFLEAISGKDSTEAADSVKPADILSENPEVETTNNAENKISEKPAAFDTAKQVLEMVDTDIQGDKELSNLDSPVSKELMLMTKDLANSILNDNVVTDKVLLNKLMNTQTSSDGTNISENEVLSLAKDILELHTEDSNKFSEGTKVKLAKLLAGNDFGKVVKDTITKQMLLKPEEAASAKNINDVYSKIMQQAEKAAQILQNSGRENPEMMNAAKNISDNVQFMNELNQVATYVQLPLLMNGKSAHGDLYVYTKKKSLKENDGNISALLHLDMENLGPMDVYVALKDGRKLNTHFYLQDDATIDFIADHIDILNKRLTEKGYVTDINVTENVKKKGGINMADEFLKDEPGKEGVTAVKYSFDVRA